LNACLSILGREGSVLMSLNLNLIERLWKFVTK
jgi:hypothetical protein